MKPKVRFIDVKPYGEKFLLSDPVGISPPLLITPELLFILSLLDGSREIREVQAEFLKRSGKIITYDELLEIINFLDENFLLYNERFINKLREEKQKLLQKG
ncbi:MAG TPA: hypothetical protein EYG91_03530, partial [Aquifex aeolicus]|nr:hypothetical protein [Aquifex aeolicus]